MSKFVDGEWQREAGESVNDRGEFERAETTFRNRIGTDEFPAQPGRYHLYISRACPWAHGVALVRKLAGLEDVVSMDVVDPYRDANGWQFTPGRPGSTPDTVNGFDYLREAYREADPDYSGRVTVPVLWDKEAGTIVNNESIEIMRMFAATLAEHATGGADLYPVDKRDEIDEIVADLYQPINNGVYRAGFARTQEAYETAVSELFDALDRWNAVLADRRYLAGDRLTLADVRLFPTLVRFDHVYHTHFKCNVHRLIDYSNLWNYTKELYQLPGVAGTVDMAHVTEHYYRTHTSINPRRIVPVGPDIDFTEPHDRDRLTGGPPGPLQ